MLQTRKFTARENRRGDEIRIIVALRFVATQEFSVRWEGCAMMFLVPLSHFVLDRLRVL
jgi:hypothetical protein